MISAEISSLLRSRRPSTVLWLVISFVILAIYGMLITRSWFHICIEVDKSVFFVKPSLADSDSPTAIVFISFASGFVTTSDHHFPYAVFRSMTETMFGQCRLSEILHLFMVKASAGFDVTRKNSIGSCNELDSVQFASTQPVPTFRITSFGLTKNGYVSKAIWFNGHRSIIYEDGGFVKRLVYEIVRAMWKHIETSGNDLSLSFKRKSNKTDNLIRYEGGGGTLRMDFKDVQFG